jgi:hypothetical protein
LVFPVVSFLLAFPPNPTCVPLLPHSCYMPRPSHPSWLDHSNYTWSTSYEAPHYAVFSNLLSLNPSLVQIFSSTPCSQTPSVYATWWRARPWWQGTHLTRPTSLQALKFSLCFTVVPLLYSVDTGPKSGWRDVLFIYFTHMRPMACHFDTRALYMKRVSSFTLYFTYQPLYSCQNWCPLLNLGYTALWKLLWSINVIMINIPHLYNPPPPRPMRRCTSLVHNFFTYSLLVILACHWEAPRTQYHTYTGCK